MKIPPRIGLLSSLVFAHCFFASGCSDPSQPDRVPVVQLDQHEVEVVVGDTHRLRLLHALPPGFVPSVKWSSSNPASATVEKTGSMVGTVRGMGPGQAVIKVSGGGASDSARVIVVSAGGG